MSPWKGELSHSRPVNHDDRQYVVEPGDTTAPGPPGGALSWVALVVAVLAATLAFAGCTSSQVPPRHVGDLTPRATAVSAAPTAGAVPAGTDPTGHSNRAAALRDLARLRVLPARPDVPGYTRSKFGPGLTDTGSDAAPGAYSGNGCRTRDDALLTQLVDPSTITKGRCKTVPRAGVLADPYTAVDYVWEYDWTSGRPVPPGTLAGPMSVQVDHVRALSDAWDYGASGWSASKRASFANDPRNLVATVGRVNVAKGDRGPSEWSPASKTGACWYAQRYVQVSRAYGLPVSRADRDDLALTIKGACPA